MNAEIFNIIINNLKNYGIRTSKNRIEVPLTTTHKLIIILNDQLIEINSINILKIINEYSFEKGIYCINCPNNYFNAAQISTLNELITIDYSNTQITKDIDKIFLA